MMMIDVLHQMSLLCARAYFKIVSITHKTLQSRNPSYLHNLILIIIIASRDDDWGWYDYLQSQNIQLREMVCEMKWGDLKCLQKPTNQMEIDGGLFPETV